jgi:type II secretory pathway component PulF
MNTLFDPRARLASPDLPGGRASAAIVLFGLAIAAALLHGLVPPFAARFEELDVPMPSLTVWLMTVSRLASQAWPLWVLAACVPVWMWRNRVSTTPLALFLLSVILSGSALATIALLLPFQPLLSSIGGKH